FLWDWEKLPSLYGDDSALRTGGRNERLNGQRLLERRDGGVVVNGDFIRGRVNAAGWNLRPKILGLDERRILDRRRRGLCNNAIQLDSRHVRVERREPS